MNKKIHFIGIGDLILSQLATNLPDDYQISGSAVVIEPIAEQNLAARQLQPEEIGWFPEKLHAGLEAIVLGKNISMDNPELLRAKALGLKIYAYPEFIYELSTDKQRIIIAGNHHKKALLKVIAHVFNFHKKPVDFFTFQQVRISEEAPVIIIEAEEAIVSPLRRQPAFMFYQHHAAVLCGLSWEKSADYQTFEQYVKAFDVLADSTPKSGLLMYAEEDDLLAVIGKKEREDVIPVGYSFHASEQKDGKTWLTTGDKKIPVRFSGEENMHLIQGAKILLGKLGITEDAFYQAIETFEG
jgi:UDP-N-acetylmuramate: L-alanyl-gamma-D-glutamyl-meso-diaminopimelate ligase